MAVRKTRKKSKGKAKTKAKTKRTTRKKKAVSRGKKKSKSRSKGGGGKTRSKRKTKTRSKRASKAKSKTRSKARSKKKPAKKAPGRKGPAKKAPGKKGPAKKAPGRKGPAKKAPGKGGPKKKAPGRRGPKKTATRASSATPEPGAGVEVTPQLRRDALSMLDGLKQQHPDARCELDFTNGLELLVATILAAQCTDKRVNMVTKDLFRKYRTAQDYVDAPSEVLEEEIRSTGFYRNKTKSIKKACQSLVDKFDGRVPDNMDDLLELAGVGRKTANVILANVYDVPGIVVDTHMLRISRRMGLTGNTDPVKVELDLMEVFPESEWIHLSHQIPWHGRRVCTARKPMCDDCGASHACPKLI